MNGRTAFAAVAATALASGILAVPSSAAAQESCTAWASVPSRVALEGRAVTIATTLRGSDGCHVKGVDNGATATLRGPGESFPHRWSHLGSADSQTFQLGVDQLGTYRFGHGDVQIYDSKDERVPSTWRSTTVTIKRAAKMHGVTRTHGDVSGHVRAFGNEGWRAQNGAVAVLEQRTGHAWQAVVQERTTATGRFVFSGLKSGRRYRVISKASPSTWGATSRKV